MMKTHVVEETVWRGERRRPWEGAQRSMMIQVLRVSRRERADARRLRQGCRHRARLGVPIHYNANAN